MVTQAASRPGPLPCPRPLAQVVRRLFVSADLLSATSDSGAFDRGRACSSEIVAFDEHCAANEQQLASASSPASVLATWLGVMRDEQVVQQTLKLLRTLVVCCNAARAGSTVDAATAALVSLPYLGQAATGPLRYLVMQLGRLRSCDQPNLPLAQQLEAELTSPEFAAAAAAALDGAAATCRSMTAWMELGAAGGADPAQEGAFVFFHAVESCGHIIAALADYAGLFAAMLDDASRRGARNGSGDGPAASSGAPHPPVPADVARLAGVLASSQLLPAVCRAVLLPPGGFGRAQGPTPALLQQLHAASGAACRSLLTVLVAAVVLHEGAYDDEDEDSQPAEAASPGEPLLELLAHPDVHRLQRATLGRLIAHGGGGGGVAGSASGSDGGWALALEEERQGWAVLPLGPSMHRATESHHSVVLQASLYVWAATLRLRGGVTGGTPPQREVAALAAAAARAGFIGVQLMPLLPEGEARAVAPDWLEAAAWAAAATVDAMSAGGLGGDIELHRMLSGHLDNLVRLAGNKVAGLASLSPAAQLGCRARLAAAGTLRTLDAALRLTAADDARAAAATAATTNSHAHHVMAVQLVSTLLNHSDALPILPSASGVQQQGQQGRGGEGDQLGVLVTAAKWARLLADGWEAPPVGDLTAAVATSAVVQGVLESGMRNSETSLRLRLAEAEAQPENSCDPRVRCVSLEHEAYALAARSACQLAAPLALCAVRGGVALGVSPEQHAVLVEGVTRVLWHLPAWLLPGAKLVLPVGQVLAAQPHRLLAAAAQLLPRTPEPHVSLARTLLAALVALAAHEQLSSRLRGWLAPPPQGGGGGGAGGELGCLREAVQGAVPCLLHIDQRECGMVLGLLKLAADDDGISGESGGGGDAFRGAGLAMLDQLLGNAAPSEWTTLPDGSSTAGLVRELVARGAGAEVMGPVAALPAAFRQLGPSAQLHRLRVCGNTLCDNFAAASEGELPLKQCSGCRAVRYCRPECQKAHWRAAHKTECAQLASRG
ncbi:hypothetical protein TSOC_013435 [Tetrabaena socialis]|uniref:MYND-type domain-containing protein n=1 Tax=Tetrabaena socialis TaxID=47790 RepID=A0A2J7ZKF5_9CHLO|nr:hypothetical protein TSOC_013435 [Tetrabaena socialis]|eukprot:PNH00730.1 hypothetical protein TSOC_013435 [Tetrabaena socialis]